MPFLTRADKEALHEAVVAVERRSSAEVVVVVRPRSGSYVHADVFAGLLFGVFMLWFQLFSPWEFSLPSILAAPVLSGLLVGWLASHVPPVRRALTTAGHRARAVRTAALAEFVERRIDTTRGRTGLLVYVSLLERAAEVVPDRGVAAAVAAAEGDWGRRVAALKETVAAGGSGRLLAARLEEMADLLAAALPRGIDDEDELSDEVIAS